MEINIYRYTLLLLLLLLSGAVRVVEGCPGNCFCIPDTRSVNCTRLPNVESMAMSIPSYTLTLDIHNGEFSEFRTTDFSQISAKTLKKLKVTSSKLKKIGDRSLSVFADLEILELSHNEIEDLHPNAFANLRMLRVLDLSHNQIMYLASPDILRPLVSVVEVNLGFNKIVDFPSGFFASQTNLLELNIQNNGIANLKGSSFQGVRNLRKLLSNSCNIQTMENDLFKSISNVETVDLSFNLLHYLPMKGEFSQLINLKHLFLQNNNIETLADNQFQGLYLESLDLSHNAISTISNNTFKHMKHLSHLDLSFNRLNSLPSLTFQPISDSLSSLKLNSNPGLGSLSATLFEGLTSLRDLNISSCGLHTLHHNLFMFLGSLQHIDLSANELTTLPAAFYDLTIANEMKFVRLDGNQWYCDCRIRDFREWLRNPITPHLLFCQDVNQILFRISCQMPKCSTPSRLENYNIAMLTDDVLDKCNHFMANSGSGSLNVVIGAIIGVIVVVIVIIVVVIVCLWYRRKQKKHFHGVNNDDEMQLNQSNNIVKQQKQTNHEKKITKTKHFVEKKEKRKQIDPEIGSLNESDKDFIVRNYFHSMSPGEDADSDCTQSMTRMDSVKSLSQSGYDYNSRRASLSSSQYSANMGCKFESAV
ncbi:toll-like receptor 2 isoform X1 [Dreissena polymorpha]|uniref:Protocadherin domain-containing protein n=2 Tax=Dreissena polymorpha TaxID=45954 RepID=A0A9D4EEA8_DREPO|nr:toll-like receptor 2 isoform X1 [Dreissena polymorpha]KAH3776655.1 hypothetical protein DPMN_178086 [Dreissena polymorpha]